MIDTLYMVEPSQEQQFLEAYDKYADAIFRYCYYRVFDRDRAKDFMQEAFVRTWKYISEGKKVDNVRAFVYRTANNLIIDDSRKKKQVSLDQLAEKGFTPNEDPREKNQDILFGKEIVSMVKELDEKYRDVILLRYVDELSIGEIAKVLGESENNVSVRINRGLKKIRVSLDEQNHEQQIEATY